MINLNNLIKDAMKAHDDVSLIAYRNLKAEIQKYETSKGAKPLDDSGQLQIFQKYAKNLEDSILQFQKADREDLVTGYRAELEVVQKLLPEPITSQELDDFINSDDNFFDQFWTVVEDYTIDPTTDYTHMELLIPKKSMGSAIKYIKSKFPTADGKVISEIIKKYII